MKNSAKGTEEEKTKKANEAEKMQFKKKNQSTMNIEARTIKFGPNGFKFFVESTNDELFKYGESNTNLFQILKNTKALEKPMKDEYANPKHGCKLLYDQVSKKLILVIVFDRKRSWTIDEKEPKMIALDPGVRTFMTGYSPSGELLEFGPQDVQKLIKIAYKIDKISSRIDKQPKKPNPNDETKEVFVNPPNKLMKQRLRLHLKIKNLREEMHRKVCNYLCQNYDVIMLPKFEVQKMIQKKKRNISKDTVRRMLLLGHYSFKMRLIAKAKQYGRGLLLVDEAYTSKTCTCCGFIHDKLGRSKVFDCPSCKVTITFLFNIIGNFTPRSISKHSLTIITMFFIFTTSYFVFCPVMTIFMLTRLQKTENNI